VKFKIVVYRHVTACALVYLYQRFEGTCRLLLHEIEGGGFLQNIDTSTKSHGFTPPTLNLLVIWHYICM